MSVFGRLGQAQSYFIYKVFEVSGRRGGMKDLLNVLLTTLIATLAFPPAMTAGGAPAPERLQFAVSPRYNRDQPRHPHISERMSSSRRTKAARNRPGIYYRRANEQSERASGSYFRHDG